MRVLFVCMGNICRSPTAEGVFRALVRAANRDGDFEIDSAGTHAYHVGEPPDERSQAVALERGIDLSHQRARRVHPADFDDFDYVLAMDRENLRLMRDQCPAVREDRLRLLLEFGPESGRLDVPDPYYGGPTGFDDVFDLVENACAGLLAEIDSGRE